MIPYLDAFFSLIKKQLVFLKFYEILRQLTVLTCAMPLQEILGKWSFKSKRYGTMYDGFMFPLHVTKELDDWPEMNVRRRRWVSIIKIIVELLLFASDYIGIGSSPS